MKKTILFLSLVVSVGGALYAQDTVWQKTAPLSNYFNNRWIDTTERYATGIVGYALSHCSARQFFTQDTLQIYGIAAMMTSFYFPVYDPTPYYPDLQSYLNATYPEDPSFNNCEESLKLYQYIEDDSMPMFQIGEDLPVHMLGTPVSYYMMTNRPPVSNWDPYPKPVYERYFSSPQTVYDTFYVGVTENEWDYIKPTCEPRIIRPSFMCVNICYPDMRCLDEVMAVYYPRCDDLGEWQFYRDYIHFIPFLFPILTPPDTTVNPGDPIVNPIDTVVTPADTLVVLPGDTIVIGGDTLVNTGDTLVIIPGEPFVIDGHTLVVNPGDTVIVIHGSNPLSISQPDLIYRYTALQPNPATQRVTVTSSFGISRIEAYDTRGRRIFKTHVSGLKADLDISSWPRGTYLLRITTTAGPTTKKLLLR